VAAAAETGARAGASERAVAAARRRRVGELLLVGNTVDQAIDRIEKFLDEASSASSAPCV
jgi:dsDNA-specific endonuclease/ATPase MutS2